MILGNPTFQCRDGTFLIMFYTNSRIVCTKEYHPSINDYIVLWFLMVFHFFEKVHDDVNYNSKKVNKKKHCVVFEQVKF